MKNFAADTVPVKSVSYDYDTYACSGCAVCYDGLWGDCYNYTYEGLTVDADSVDARLVVAELLECAPEDVPADVLDVAVNELGLNNASAYQTEVDYGGGFCGDAGLVVLVDPARVGARLAELVA